MLRKSAVPIFFYHVDGLLPRDSLRFIDVALRQASLASPENDVVLVTDKVRELPDSVIQIATGEYESATSAFRSLYVHMSVNPPRYEMNCFLRWFYFGAIARRFGVRQFCAFDSDILLFSPVSVFIREFEGYSAGNWTWANFFNDLEALDLICEHFLHMFKDRAALSALAPHVCDMNLLREFAATNRKYLDQNTIRAKGFDDGIRQSNNGMFAMERAMKSLSIDPNGVPIARRVSDNRAVPFHFLHFHGEDAKVHMRKFAWSDEKGNRMVIPTDTPRNSACPCGSGLRYKHCHGYQI